MKFDARIYPRQYTAMVLELNTTSQNIATMQKNCTAEYSDFDY